MTLKSSYAGEPEIIPPGQPLRRERPGGATLTDANLDQLAHVLDDIFRLPGTRIRFGLDAIVGLVPAVGDMLSSIAGFVIIFAAWQRRLPRVTVARMVANTALDTAMGSIPFLGDLLDVAWKANRRNYELLHRSSADYGRAQTWRDWLFFVLLLVAVAALVALPFAVLVWIVTTLRR